MGLHATAASNMGATERRLTQPTTADRSATDERGEAILHVDNR